MPLLLLIFGLVGIVLTGCNKGRLDRTGELWRAGIFHSGAYRLKSVDGAEIWQIECFEQANCALRARSLCANGFEQTQPVPRPKQRFDLVGAVPLITQFGRCTQT